MWLLRLHGGEEGEEGSKNSDFFHFLRLFLRHHALDFFLVAEREGGSSWIFVSNMYELARVFFSFAAPSSSSPCLFVRSPGKIRGLSVFFNTINLFLVPLRSLSTRTPGKRSKCCPFLSFFLSKRGPPTSVVPKRTGRRRERKIDIKTFFPFFLSFFLFFLLVHTPYSFV